MGPIEGPNALTHLTATGEKSETAVRVQFMPHCAKFTIESCVSAIIF
jgi:hypothetical protein